MTGVTDVTGRNHPGGSAILAGAGMAGMCLTACLRWHPHLLAAALHHRGSLAALGLAVTSARWPWSHRRRIFPFPTQNQPESPQARFHAAAENSLDAFCLLDAERNETGAITGFHITYANAIATRLLPGVGKGDVKSLFSAAGPAPGADSLFEKVCRVVNHGEPLLEEVEIRDPHVHATWLRYQVVRLSDGVAITLTDITDQKAGEHRMRELGEFTESIFENAPFSIIATDAEGLIIAMNETAEKLCSYHRDDLVGKAPITLLHDRKELQARAKELKLRTSPALEGFDVLTAKAASGGLDEQEWTMLRGDGARMPVNVAVRGLHSETGETTGFVWITFDVTERRAMMEYVTHLATHDQLTGLVGRAVLQDRIRQAVERARRYGTKVAIFVIDLDHFKRINDSLGHWAGDQVLLETAARLRLAVRSSDTVARMGGDEFVVVLEDITNIADVELCAGNLLTRFSPEMLVEDHQLHVTASVGVCVFPDFAGDVRSLLKWADAAMYEAKEGGRNQFQMFREEMLKDGADRLSLERALRLAIQRNELRLHYQPHVSLVTGEVVGMEALLRWEHPERGLLLPAQFIALAEETGLILPLGDWALNHACLEGKALRDELGMDLTLSVNLSPRQFQQKDLVDVVTSALEQSGLPARNLEVEITENTLMVNSVATFEKLQQMRALGVRTAIDDFGTGFCNFKYLLDYAVDRLKIDQQFVKLAVTDANAAAVVRSIIAMSHGLNIKVVAEGVESEEQFRFLVRKRCDEAQGYFLARPVPASEFAKTVRACNAVAALRSA